MPALIVEVSRRATRALDLGKGMFFDADAMALLAKCGALDAIQSAAAAHLKERASERLEARSSAKESGSQRSYTPPPVKAFEHRRPPSLRLVETGSSPSAEAKEAWARARRAVETPKRPPK